jgi:hypothetical protein
VGNALGGPGRRRQPSYASPGCCRKREPVARADLPRAAISYCRAYIGGAELDLPGGGRPLIIVILNPRRAYTPQTCMSGLKLTEVANSGEKSPDRFGMHLLDR